jgi:hypothetical protein
MTDLMTRFLPLLSSVLLPVGIVGVCLHFGDAASAETVQRRDGFDPETAARVSFAIDGVQCTRESGVTILVPWDRVRSIEDITDPSLREAWAIQQPIAEELWRARARVQRGDARLAEPLFERHFDRMMSAADDSELRLIVAEGLLRVRLARGAIEEAMPAALETIRLRRAGVTTDRYEGLTDIIDERFWLVPALPPIVTNQQQTELLPESLRLWIEAEDPFVRAMASGYASRSGSPKSADAASGAGLGLLGAALDSLAPEAEVRDQARGRLVGFASAEGAPSWLDAWSRWFQARSLLKEPDQDIDLALLQLLNLPARHLEASPALASRAVALAADVLEEAGRLSEAALLRRELRVSQANVPPALHFESLLTDEPAQSESP